MGADNDAHSAECYRNSLKVGIADEVAYPKNVSWFRVDGYGRSDYHSNRLGELSKSSSGRKLKYPGLGKRRANVSGESIFLKFLTPLAK